MQQNHQNFVDKQETKKYNSDVDKMSTKGGDNVTDTVKLEKAIADSGLKKARIAAELKVTYQTLKRKINNEVPFNASEISKMCDLLRISKLSEKEAIFFACDVDK